MNEIWRHGYQACSAKALSEKLGITRSSFYNAFGSREQLFREALALYAEMCPDRKLAEPDHDGSILDLIAGTLRELCKARAADPEARGCMAVNSISELVASESVLGAELTHNVLGNIDRLENLLRLAVENGELAGGTDLRAKAMALQNLLIGVSVLAKAVRSEEELWASARETLTGLGLYREPDPTSESPVHRTEVTQ